jgi:hypothetical protein
MKWQKLTALATVLIAAVAIQRFPVSSKPGLHNQMLLRNECSRYDWFDSLVDNSFDLKGA